MFNRLGKKLRKTLQGVNWHPPPPPLPPSTSEGKQIRYRDLSSHQFAPGHEQLLLFSHQKDTTFL